MSPAPADADREHLRLLSIFHYIVGGLAALFSLLPFLHLFMGIAMLTGRLDSSQPPEARLFGWFFILFAAAMIACGLAYSVGLIVAGRFLERRIHYTFCFVMAALSCVFVPFGTVLGVLTIIVLARPTVKELFQQSSARQNP